MFECGESNWSRPMAVKCKKPSMALTANLIFFTGSLIMDLFKGIWVCLLVKTL